MEQKNKMLCPNCKTGLDMLMIDAKEPMCPFLGNYTEEGCSGYLAIDGGEKECKRLSS